MIENKVFESYLEEVVGKAGVSRVLEALDNEAETPSVRLNPLKSSECLAGIRAENVPWSPLGVYLSERPSYTLDPFFHAGAYYVQDSSSMFVGKIFRDILPLIADGHSKLRVLDLCAAPGGKTTDLAASLRAFCGDSFVLVANEVMRQRTEILKDNVALWGDPNVVVTSCDPADFKRLESWFDIIVADVPCSGEGMFRTVKAREQWSADLVNHCVARQKRIVADVWPSLKDGGVFVYSTCTFNKYENDLNIKWIVDELGAQPLFNSSVSSTSSSVQTNSTHPTISDDGVIRTEYGFSLCPGFVPGNGQYCSAVSKGRCISPDRVEINDNCISPEGVEMKAEAGKEFTSKYGITTVVSVDYRTKGDLVKAVPSNIAIDVDMLERVVHVLQSGFAVGTLKGKTLVPAADMALSIALSSDSYPEVDLDREMALKFLHRDAVILPSDTPRGYVRVMYGGLALGFVKNIGNRTNNLHPNGRRILMDV